MGFVIRGAVLEGIAAHDLPECLGVNRSGARCHCRRHILFSMPPMPATRLCPPEATMGMPANVIWLKVTGPADLQKALRLSQTYEKKQGTRHLKPPQRLA